MVLNIWFSSSSTLMLQGLADLAPPGSWWEMQDFRPPWTSWSLCNLQDPQRNPMHAQISEAVFRAYMRFHMVYPVCKTIKIVWRKQEMVLFLIRCAQCSKTREARKQLLFGFWNVQTLNTDCRLKQKERVNIEVSLSETWICLMEWIFQR